MGLISTIGAAAVGLLNWFGKRKIGDTLEKIVKLYQADKSADAEIAKADATMLVAAINAHNDQQKAKMQVRAFWFLIVMFLAPMWVKWTMINLFDVFWCAGCMAPQDWTIAAYQPPYDKQADTAFNWLFGGLGVGGGALLLVKALKEARR
jgi:hypothetical protein